MKKFILAALATTTIAAALPTVALADTACTVTVTKFHQSYPYSGRATVEYTVGGALPVGAFAEITINTDGASATFTQNNIVAGANTNVIDFASSFGGALVLSNASFTVRINPGDNNLGGVQLWENGPYWAECNVGASEPEECGYYFWWGDTVGYTRSGGVWDDDYYHYSGVTWVSSTGQSMSSSPFDWNSCPTMGKDNSTLQSEGYIDATGNLVAAHDAATAHLGAPWRMPTDAEHDDLINNCDWTWTAKNGVNGYEFRGRGDYASNSIFLPAAGHGYDSRLRFPGSDGDFWSSTPNSDDSDYAWQIDFSSGYFYRYNDRYERHFGQSVRPVRFAGCSAGGVVTFDPVTIVIGSVADWDALSAAVAGGLETEGVLVLLANDVGPVTNMVGDSVHPFAGVFNGNGHTLTVAISGTGDCAAPFSVIDGAMISNLVVTGTISGGNHSAGLVGTCGATGPNVIRDCTVSVAVSGTGYLGGIVGHGGQGTLSFEGCVFSGSVSGFSAFAGGLMGWSNTMALNVTNCLSAGAFAPAGGGAYHPIACKRANQTVTAAVADAYWIHTVVPTTMGGYLIPGAEGTPVSATLVAGEWAQPVTAADGNTYYAWTPAPAGRLLARFSFDDAGNGGLNLLHAAVGQDAIVRATQTTPVAGIGDIAAVTDAAILSGLAVGDGAVAVTNGQYLAVPIPAPLLTAHGRPYTVVMKIRVPNTRGWRSLVNMPASNDTDAMIYLQESTRNIYLKQFNKASGYGVGAANGFVPAEQWATITFAFGENATDVWLDDTAVLHRTDGTLAGSYADCAAAGGYILVGADDSGDDELFHLSEFRIYEGAASAAVHLLLPGSGTPAAPYLISSTADWNTFASNVCVGVNAAACYRLTADITVTETVGTQDHPFRGTFDGGGHTLTANLSGTDAYLAPFSALDGATILNLIVNGWVRGGMHCAGLVGALIGGGTNTIENCKVAATIMTSGTHCGGIVGHGGSSATTIAGCVFAGWLYGGSGGGTLCGWGDGMAMTVVDCFDASISEYPIGCGEGAVAVSNTYYYVAGKHYSYERAWDGANCGKLAYRVMNNGVELDFGAPAATYATSGITAYPAGIRYNGGFYAGEGDSINIAVAGGSSSAIEGIGLWASEGSIVESSGVWTLTMPSNLVTLSPLRKISDGAVLSGDFIDGLPFGIVAGATVTLSNAVIEPSGGPGIICLGDAVIVLEGTNVARSFPEDYPGYPGIQAGPTNTTLEIRGGGSLTVEGDEFSPGIGSGFFGECGDIVISGGTITATGGRAAAGIGSGFFGECGDITITDGVTLLTSVSSESPSNIGAGRLGVCGTVTVGGMEMGEIVVTPYVYRPSGVPFTVHFDANGGSGAMADQSFAAGIPQNLQSNAFTRAGLLFHGWNTRADGGGAYYYDSQPATFGSDTTLYAQWCGANVTLTPETGDVTLSDGQVLAGTGGTNTCVVVVPGATVTISNVTIVDSYMSPCAGITCLGDATIILEGANVVRSLADNYPGILAGPTNTTLVIRGPGSLTAEGAFYGSGIGSGGDGMDCGNIEISGGMVTATGGNDAAGIGSGAAGSCGDITIGADVLFVVATCGEWGLNPIGAGAAGTCGTVTIAPGLTDEMDDQMRWLYHGVPMTEQSGEILLTDGQTLWGEGGPNTHVTIADGATVVLGGCFLGGDDSGNPSTPWAGITCLGDATIILVGNNEVSGFCEGYPGVFVPTNKTLVIRGTGSLMAWAAGVGAAAIGGGYGMDCGNIVIEGGWTLARGGDGAAAIGAGAGGSCGAVTIGGTTYPDGIADRFAVCASIGTTEEWDVLVEEWDDLASAYGRLEDARAYFWLTSDAVKVYSMMGYEYPFCGTFDGCGHTLTLLTQDLGEGVQIPSFAPFYAVNGATIKNVKVVGEVYGANSAAGLVGYVAGGTNRIENCVVEASFLNVYRCGGIVYDTGEPLRKSVPGSGDVSTTLAGCVFDGYIDPCCESVGTLFWGGRSALVDCLDLSDSEWPVFLEGDGVVSNTYYTSTNKVDYYGMGIPGARATATAAKPASIGAEVTDYGFVKAYAFGLEYGGMYYVMEGAVVAEDGTAVPNEWLAQYYPGQEDSYATIVNSTAANGRKVWACYVADLDPTDPDDDLVAGIDISGGKVRVYILKGESSNRYYRFYGRETLDSTPVDVTYRSGDLSNTIYRFFHVEVSLDPPVMIPK